MPSATTATDVASSKPGIDALEECEAAVGHRGGAENKSANRAFNGLGGTDRRREPVPAECSPGVVLRRIADHDRSDQQQRRIASADESDGRQRPERDADVEDRKERGRGVAQDFGARPPARDGPDPDDDRGGKAHDLEWRAVTADRYACRGHRRAARDDRNPCADRGGEVDILGKRDRRREHGQEQRRVRGQQADDRQNERRESHGAEHAGHQRPATTGLLMPP